MASIRKRGNSYLIVVSMGYDYNGNRIKSQQKTVRPPEELTPKQTEKWLNEQAVLFERSCKDDPQPKKNLTLAQYTELWLRTLPPRAGSLQAHRAAARALPKTLRQPASYEKRRNRKATLRKHR